MVEGSGGSIDIGGSDDYLTQAVTKLNGLHGDIRLTEGDNITLEVVGNKVVISASGGQGGGITDMPQATDTELGGIRASERLNEDIEVKIDKDTGKLYVPTPDVPDLPIPNIHGLPPGGKAGQILVKVGDTDYNVEWTDPPTIESGGGTRLTDIRFFTVSNMEIGNRLALTNLRIPKEE